MGDVQIVSESRKMVTFANSLAVVGLPKVIEMLKDGDARTDGLAETYEEPVAGRCGRLVAFGPDTDSRFACKPNNKRR